jgi:hypothetical protein
MDKSGLAGMRFVRIIAPEGSPDLSYQNLSYQNLSYQNLSYRLARFSIVLFGNQKVDKLPCGSP